VDYETAEPATRHRSLCTRYIQFEMPWSYSSAVLAARVPDRSRSTDFGLLLHVAERASHSRSHGLEATLHTRGAGIGTGSSSVFYGMTPA